MRVVVGRRVVFLVVALVVVVVVLVVLVVEVVEVVEVVVVGGIVTAFTRGAKGFADAGSVLHTC